MLLRFRVANHRSIRDEAEFSLASASLRGARPVDGDWTSATLRTAGIYGSNASGKSTVLDALDFLCQAVRNSVTRWNELKAFPYHPFALDGEHRRLPSLYEIDFVADGTRYSFGFRSASSGIHEEWLYSFPTARRRVLFERSGSEFTFGRNLPGENVRLSKLVGERELFLSSAASNKHPLIRRLHHDLTNRIRFARFREDDKLARLGWIARLVGDEDALKVAESLLKLADFGVTGIRVEEVEVPKALRNAFMNFIEDLRSSSPGSALPESPAIESIRKQLQFYHGADRDGQDFYLPITEESSGTVAWLALAVPAVDALRRGDVFLVDEIDSSLHPMLTASLLDLFRNDKVNMNGAQLVFTSHDTSLLGSLHRDSLRPEEVWLTEKGVDGATTLYSLAEFPIRARDNLERRYMQGRYGAVPVIAQEEIRSTLAKSIGAVG